MRRSFWPSGVSVSHILNAVTDCVPLLVVMPSRRSRQSATRIATKVHISRALWHIVRLLLTVPFEALLQPEELPEGEILTQLSQLLGC
jgi:hypothetical protein